MNALEILSRGTLLHSCPLWNMYNVPEINTVYYKCKPESKDVNDSEYRNEALMFTKIIESNRQPNLLCDARNFLYPISPETQEWIDRELSPRWVNAGMRKFALVFPEDFIAKLGVEQAVEELSGTYLTRYFTTEQEAIDWFNS